jgi:predicted permease
MNSIAQRLAAQFPESNTGFGVELTPLADTIVGSVRTQLLVLAGAVALVLLVACANVANLLLTRASTRTREIAVRTAIGAGRLRLIRQFLTESIVLALAGGVLGLIVVYLGTPLLLAIAAPKLPRLTDIGVDWRVFGFLFAVSIVTGITFGLAPALASSRGDVQGTLKGAAGLGGSARFFRRFRDGLAAVEVAMAFVLVIGAGLLVREFGRLRNTETGLQPANVLTMHLMPNMSAEDCYALVPQVQALPGVRTAAFAQMLPLQSWGWTATFSIKGRPPFPPAERPVIELRYVTPGYFDALGIPVRGRAFDDGDGAKSARVIIVNETLARRYLAGLDPIGLETDRGRIVGVAQDVRSAGLDRPTLAEVYYPMIQNYSQVRDLGMSMIISTNVPPETLTAPARDLIRRTHPSLAIFGVRTMEQIVSDSLSETSLYTWLVGSFALLALVLASAGIYGVMSYAVAARTREFGIRFALGADRRGVQRLVLRHAAAVAGVGIGIGLVGMMVSVRFLESLIVGGGRVQPLPVAAAGAVLALVALMASIVPARRAASVDPMGALREE